MQMAGLCVYPTDIGVGGDYVKDFSKAWIQPEFIDHVTAIKKYGAKSDVLFMSWPPREDDMAAYTVEQHLGSKVIYIGECWGGCTGNDSLFTALIKSFDLVDTIRIPTWSGVFDKMYFYQRKKLINK